MRLLRRVTPRDRRPRHRPDHLSRDNPLATLYRIVVHVVRIPNVWGVVFYQPRDSTMNGHGGKRPGAGRPKGAASRVDEQVRQEAAATGELPLAYMLRIMDPSQPVGRRDEMAKAAAVLPFAPFVG
jgi:hypothetical protein